MKRNVEFINASTGIQKKVALKYLQIPDKAVIEVPNSTGKQSKCVVEIWFEGEFYWVTVTEDDLHSIFWEYYLNSTDDGESIHFEDKDRFIDFEDPFDHPII